MANKRCGFYRVEICPICEGEREISVVTHISREDGEPDGWHEPCGMCDGTGAVFVKLAPITMADLPPPVGDPTDQ